MEYLLHFWNGLVANFAKTLVAPSLDFLHLAGLSKSPRDIAAYFLLAFIQIGIIAGLLRPMETLLPAEAWTNRRLTRIDRLYTLLKLLVVVPAVNYLVVAPLFHDSAGTEHPAPLQLEHLIPWLQAHPLGLFLIYLALYDFTLYIVHRLQHAVPWWWGLHSLHHSQRQLSCWSNDRDHYLDDLIEILILGGVSALIGVAPVEYAALVLFGTARYQEPPHPCGVDDPNIDADNQRGLAGQQLAGFKRRASSTT